MQNKNARLAKRNFKAQPTELLLKCYFKTAFIDYKDLNRSSKSNSGPSLNRCFQTSILLEMLWHVTVAFIQGCCFGRLICNASWYQVKINIIPFLKFHWLYFVLGLDTSDWIWVQVAFTMTKTWQYGKSRDSRNMVMYSALEDAIVL